MGDGCEFCRLLARDDLSYAVYEDEATVAFLDRDPAVEGHTLVVPRAHESELLTAAEPTTEAVFRTVRTVARAIERTLEPSGFSVFHTSGSLVGHVDHAHVHVLPRSPDDDIHVALSRRPLDEASAASLAAAVRENL
ncbi:MAG: HIT family protein [Haloarculaceae archaeon]